MPDDFIIVSYEDIYRRSRNALLRTGAYKENIQPVAEAIAEAEAEGISSHGVAYLPTYCLHLECGKVNGWAPLVSIERPRPGAIRVDAAGGFAHRAITAGTEPLVIATKNCGVAGLAVRNSYNCGVLGYHTRRLAKRNIVVLGFTNAPASIAPSGGTKAVLGTNPFSLAVPDGRGDASLVIDQSASVVAKSEVMKHAREGRPLPAGWALDAAGQPTTDPKAALAGSMAPAGGYKGVGAALLTEVFAAALTGANLGIDASPFSGDQGGPPGTGQFFLGLDPDAFGDHFKARMDALLAAFAEQGARIPGASRKAAREKVRDESSQGVLVDLMAWRQGKAVVKCIRINRAVWEKAGRLAQGEERATDQFNRSN